MLDQLEGMLRADPEGQSFEFENPASGTLRWTGNLRAGESIIIEDGRANVGSISGDMLPGLPVRIVTDFKESADAVRSRRVGRPALGRRPP